MAENNMCLCFMLPIILYLIFRTILKTVWTVSGTEQTLQSSAQFSCLVLCLSDNHNEISIVTIRETEDGRSWNGYNFSLTYMGSTAKHIEAHYVS